MDITYIMLDNSTYGLTKGQASPTTGKNSSARSLPYGAAEDNLNPIGLALAYNASSNDMWSITKNRGRIWRWTRTHQCRGPSHR